MAEEAEKKEREEKERREKEEKEKVEAAKKKKEEADVKKRKEEEEKKKKKAEVEEEEEEEEDEGQGLPVEKWMEVMKKMREDGLWEAQEGASLQDSQANLDGFVKSVPKWSKEGLLEHIIDLVVSDNQVHFHFLFDNMFG